jgi:hypothetical protein
MSIQFHCLYCGNRISAPAEDAATRIYCPECGRAVTVPSRPRQTRSMHPPSRLDDGGHPMLIERTSKQWKALQMVGSVIIPIGFVALCAGSSTFGIILLILGGATSIFGIFGAWWNHA